MHFNMPKIKPQTSIELFSGFFFETSTEHANAFKAWCKERENQYVGAIGGLLTYEITPTSLGLIVSVKDCKTLEKFELTDFHNW